MGRFRSLAFILIFALQFLSNLAYSQYGSGPGIYGSTCVAPNVAITYAYTGTIASNNNLTWCATGGAITGSSGCLFGASTNTNISTITVTWTSTGNHSLTVTQSVDGNSAAIYPTISSALVSGNITSGQTQTINYNTASSPINCDASTGGNCPSNYYYIWQQSPDAVNFTDIASSTNQNYSSAITLTVTTYFRRKVTDPNASGSIAYSNVATVSVNPPPLTAGLTSPVYQQTNNYTGTPKNITANPSTLVTCPDGACITYQWQQSSDQSTWTNIANYTSLIYNPGQYLPLATSYYRLKSMASGQTIFSAVDTIITTNVHITGPVDCWTGQTVTYYNTEGSTAGYTWSISTGGSIIGNSTGVGSITVQWTQSNNQTVTLNNNGTYLTLPVYVHLVSLAQGVIGKPLQLLETTSSIYINTFPGTASGGSCLGNFTYLWQQSVDSINYTSTGQTTTDLTITPTQNTYYRRQVTCGSTIAYTDISYVLLYPYFHPGIITSGNSDSIPWNTTPALINGNLPDGGVDTSYHYQWEYSMDGTNYLSVPNSGNGLNYQSGDRLTQNTYYRRRVTNGVMTRYTNAVLIKVKVIIYNPGTITPYTIVINTGATVALTGTIATGGTVASYNYQWQQSLDELKWQNCSNGATQNFTTPSLTRTTYYRRFTTNGAQSAFSNVPGFLNTVKVKIGAGVNTLNVPTTVTQSSTDGSVVTVPVNSLTYSGLTSAKVNYERIWNVSKPGITTLAAAKALTVVSDYQQSTTYFDDLGREIETVAKQAAPDNSDLISVLNYDILGRTSQKYLPYTDALATGNLRTDAPTQQPGFYNTMYGNLEGYYYNNTQYDASPLNRAWKETAPGNSWGGTNIGIRTDYTFNSSLDSVKIWTIGNNISDTSLITGTYPPGSLALVITTDEAENKTMEYKDKEGKVVLKKVQISDTLFNGYYGWLSTYYVYDVLNRLRSVIQPKAVQYAWTNGWALNSLITNELCFKYNYDASGKMITKKVPGAGNVDMVYDARNRLVMTQDSIQRLAGNWMVNVYDTLNRTIKSAIWTNASTRATHQALAQSSINYPTLNGTFTILIESFYDDYSWQNRADIALNHQFSSNFNNTTDLPIIFGGAYAQTPLASSHTRGILTGSKVYVLDPNNTNSYLYGTSFYDEYNRVVQIQQQNVTSGWDTVTTRYNFNGTPLSICAAHGIVSSISPIKWNKLVTAYNFDLQGRILNTNKYINGSTITNTIAANTYDKLGRLQVKKLGAQPLETLTYDYNIRGWLKGINKNYVNGINNINWFGMELGYDFGYTGNQLNGNIAGTKWKSKGDAVARAYGFGYDNINRLMKGDFTQNNGSGFVKDAQVDFNLDSMRYDQNGNILLMQQKGVVLNTSQIIDHLAYGYSLANGWTNKLGRVTDNSGNTATLGDFKDGTNSGDDYGFDGNGNLQFDNNKKISKINYNYLNLPSSLAVTGKGTINYIYDAGGNKLKKIIIDSTITPVKTTTTTYSPPYIYINDTLQLINHEEGRIRPKLIVQTNGWVASNIQYVYDYFIKDHLGNVRLTLTEESSKSTYAATEETKNASVENSLFDSVGTTQLTKPVGFDTDTSNHYVSRLNANSTIYKRVGPTILLKVMAGDTLTASTYAWYNTPVQPPTGPSLLGNLAQGLTNAVIGNSGGHFVALQQPAVNSAISASLQPLITTKDAAYTNTLPKAFINWALFDERLNYVSGGVTQVQVINAGDAKKVITATVPATITKNGYLYIYVSNESPQDVFFDDVTIQYKKGPLLDETHYYPFGLTMASISSKAAGKLQNKYGITGKEKQSQEFSDGSGLEEYDFGARFYDHQIGRWNTIDPHIANYYWLSPYNYCNNNPIKYLDPSGMDPEKSTEEKPKDLSEVVVVAKRKPNNSLANRGLFWGNSAASPAAKLGMSRQAVYQQARDNGVSQADMTNSWSKQGIDDADLNRFERGYQAEVDYKNMSLIAVGSIGAPILAIGGVETGALAYLGQAGISGIMGSGNLYYRGAAGIIDALYQLGSTGSWNSFESLGAMSGFLAYGATTQLKFSSSTGIAFIKDATFKGFALNSAGALIGGAVTGNSGLKGAQQLVTGTLSNITSIASDQINQATDPLK